MILITVQHSCIKSVIARRKKKLGREELKMEEHGKIFKKIEENSRQELYYYPYDVANQNYVDLIKVARKEGLKQVIINSKIMFVLMDYVIKSDGFVNRITFNEGASPDFVASVNSLVERLRNDKTILRTLKAEIEWALNEESIDIARLHITLIEKKSKNEDEFLQGQILSNGIIISSKDKGLFNSHFKKVIEDHLNGRV